jgi:hypothetical protein
MCMNSYMNWTNFHEISQLWITVVKLAFLFIVKQCNIHDSKHEVERNCRYAHKYSPLMYVYVYLCHLNTNLNNYNSYYGVVPTVQLLRWSGASPRVSIQGLSLLLHLTSRSEYMYINILYIFTYCMIIFTCLYICI